MTVLKPRSHIFSVRLSYEEYLAITELCSKVGARSISDLARDAMRRLVSAARQESEGKSAIDELRVELKTLHDKVDILTDRLVSPQDRHKCET